MLIYQPGILGCCFANGLPPHCLFMAHLSRRRELSEHAGNGEFRHLVAPDGAHHQRGYEHVAPKVRRIVGKARHQLLARDEQFHTTHLSLQPARSHNGRVVRSGAPIAGGICRGEKTQKLGREDLLASERGEGRRSSRYANSEGDALP